MNSKLKPMMSPTRRSIDRAKLLLCAACLLALTVSLPSTASALAVMFDGPTGYGTSEASAEAAFDAGIPMLEASYLLDAASAGVSIPAPSDINAALVGSPSPSNPNTATSTWTVNRSGEDADEDLWLIFTNTTPDPTTSTSYDGSDVGIDLQLENWALLHFEWAPEYFYPAVHVGSGESVTFLMHHIIATDLQQSGDTLVLPRYTVNVAVDPGIVPEPAGASLVLLALGTLVTRRLRAR